jgi:ABC-type maltose transport system permease subunit
VPNASANVARSFRKSLFCVAEILLSAIPLIVIFVVAQDKIVEGFSFGSK